jgi:predicted nucleotidyltransferase component of viral defense system
LASFPDLLSPLQKEILDAVSGDLRGLFLTGGTALGPFYLGHRRSADLDLFTRVRDGYDSLVRQFVALMEGRSLKLVPGNAGPGFRRFVVSNSREDVPVDLVLDTAPQIADPLLTSEGLAVDSLEDIAANKLGAIMGRSEVRDYVDLYFLAKAGRDPLASLEAARRKDAGVDAATLAFVLSDIKVRRDPEGLEQPLSASALESFIADLRHRFAKAAFPKH